jgi:hypothetical protein
MKKVLIIILLLGLIYPAARSAAADNKAVLGSWKCAVVDVAPEYSNSLITFIEKEGKLTGSIKFDSGNEVMLTSVKHTNGQLVLTLYVEGYSITVNGKVAGSKMTGTVDTPDGKVNFTAIKAPEKKE